MFFSLHLMETFSSCMLYIIYIFFFKTKERSIALKSINFGFISNAMDKIVQKIYTICRSYVWLLFSLSSFIFISLYQSNFPLISILFSFAAPLQLLSLPPFLFPPFSLQKFHPSLSLLLHCTPLCAMSFLFLITFFLSSIAVFFYFLSFVIFSLFFLSLLPFSAFLFFSFLILRFFRYILFLSSVRFSFLVIINLIIFLFRPFLIFLPLCNLFPLSNNLYTFLSFSYSLSFFLNCSSSLIFLSNPILCYCVGILSRISFYLLIFSILHFTFSTFFSFSICLSLSTALSLPSTTIYSRWFRARAELYSLSRLHLPS